MMMKMGAIWRTRLNECCELVVARVDERGERGGGVVVDGAGDQLARGRRAPVAVPVSQRPVLHARRPPAGGDAARPAVLVPRAQDAARLPRRLGEHLRVRRRHGGHAALRRVPAQHVCAALLPGQLQAGHEHVRRTAGRRHERPGHRRRRRRRRGRGRRARHRSHLTRRTGPYTIFGPIPLCHALSLSLLSSSFSWTSHAACAIAIAGVRQ